MYAVIPGAEEDRARIWNDYYQAHDHRSLRFDDWLLKHERLFGANWSFIEFGCGFGRVSEALLERGRRVLSTDLSTVALKKLKERLPAAQVMTLDLERPLPFPDGVFDCAVADLCLHYFDRASTETMLLEIARILKPRGCLLGRVNSTDDVHHGAGEGLEVEPGLYYQAGHYKRFFDEALIRELFREWKLVTLGKYDIHRHERPKNVYEIVVRTTS
jgi:SAM-dependent methyltransferase